MRRGGQARRSGGLTAALALFVGLTLTPDLARAGNGGEARSVLRDGERPYTVVAGEADASAVVQNPANLGYLQGFNAVLDMAFLSQTSGRRGSGVGIFAAVPLPWDILALGMGVQALWRTQDTGDISLESVDSGYAKLTFALAVPLMRWAPGLSIGAGYSRLMSPDNQVARGTNAFDLAVSWRANRFLSLALMVRHVNAPVIAGRSYRAVFDPELALRPLGNPTLEFAVGMRAAGVGPARPTLGFPVEPRGRILVGARGIRAYAEAELMAYYDKAGLEDQASAAVRFNVGVQFDSPHFGIAAGPSFGLATRDVDGLHGATLRLRASHERYTEVLPTRPRRVTRLSLAGKSSDRQLAELVWIVDDLARRRGGVLLVEAADSGFALAQVEELREALLRFQGAGGKVAVYLEGGGLRDYFLASVADRIIAHPHRALSITGLRVNFFYFAELLAKLGVQAEFVRIAEYKGTPERFMRMAPSPPVAEANQVLLTDTWNHLVRLIARARARDPAVVSGWVDAAPWQPAPARTRGLVDALALPDELDRELESWLDRRVRIEAPPKAPTRPGDWRDPAHVAVLHVTGDIVEGPLADVQIIAVGAGAGGHAGAITQYVLVPWLVDAVKVPVIASG
ncbi:MAG: S49 family peptidase, partial [Myxococcales bacterium]|nr:S49 family peptidase [Myxococcales bacterium]